MVVSLTSPGKLLLPEFPFFHTLLRYSSRAFLWPVETFTTLLF